MHQSQLKIAVSIYNQKKSWEAYKLTVENILASGLVSSDDDEVKEVYPNIIIRLADKDGEPFN